MYQIVWKFDVAPGRDAEFEREYGAEGSWAALFRRSPDFVRTELFRATVADGQYLTLDLWRSREAFERFRREHAADYEALDARTESLTLNEQRISAGNVADAPAFTIRRAVRQDAPALSELMRRTFVDAFGAQNRPEDIAAYARASYGVAQQEGEIADPAYVTLVVEREGELIAFAQIRLRGSPAVPPEARAVEIYRFYVLQRWHGGGVAQELMREASRVAQETGAESVWLGVWERNPRAIAFYRRCGFEVAGAQKFTIGRDVQTDHVMLAKLPLQL